MIWRFVQGVVSAMYTTAAMTAVADLSTAANRGQSMAVYHGSILIGAGLGPALGGLIADAPWACFVPSGIWDL